MGSIITISSGLLICFFIGLMGYTSFSLAVFQPVFEYTAYWLVTATLALWGIYSWLFFRDKWRNKEFSVSSLVVPVLLSVVAILVVVFAVDQGYRVLSDETNLIGVSQSLAFEKRASNITMGEFYYEVFHPKAYDLPKRPILFATLLSYYHTFFGYDYQHGFRLNETFLFVLFFLCAALIWQKTRSIWLACTSVCVLVAQPILLVLGRSAGFDFLQGLMLVGSLWILYEYLRQPRALTFVFLWMQLILLVQTRYESGIYFLVIVGVLVFVRRKQLLGDIYSNRLLMAVTPILLSHRVWQHLLTKSKHLENSDAVLMSFDNAMRNIPIFFQSFFLPNEISPFPWILNWLSALVILIGLFVQRKKYSSSLRWTLVAASLAFFAHILTIMFHYEGLANSPASYRYFLPIILLPTIGSVLVTINFDKKWHPSCLAVALGAVIVGLPIASQDAGHLTLILTRKIHTIYRWLDENAPDQRHLIVSDRPGTYAVRQQGSISFGHFRQNTDRYKFNMERKLFTNILVIQNISYETGMPQRHERISDEIKLLPLYEFQNSETHMVRISRIQTPD